jgi:hypothetical protein
MHKLKFKVTQKLGHISSLAETEKMANTEYVPLFYSGGESESCGY